MIDEKDLIDNISIEEKVNIITNIFKNNNYSVNLMKTKLEDLNLRMYKKVPHISKIISSWNPLLMEEYGKYIGYKEKENNKEIFIVNENTLEVQHKKYKILPNSEDGYLTGKILSSYIKGLEVNINTAVDGLYFGNEYSLLVEKDYNERVIKETLFKSSQMIIEEGNPSFVINSDKTDDLANRFRDFLIQELKYNNFINQTFSLDEFIKFNHFSIKSSDNHLLKLIDEYSICENKVNSGEMSQEEFDILVKENKIINPKIIDEVFSKLIEFKNKVSSRELIEVENSENIVDNILSESVVLLKNINKCLPIAPKSKSIIFIDAYNSILNKNDLTEINKISSELKISYGFNSKLNKDKNYIPASIARAKTVQNTIVVLPSDTSSVGVKDLLKKLKKTKTKLIGIIRNNISDISINEYFDALIQYNVENVNDIKILMKVIQGEVNPSGKLAYSLPYEHDKYASSRTKIGPFIGYKYFDMSHYPVAYPFGYGLSYTTFNITDMKVSEHLVTVNVTNTGKVAGSEVVQVYIGHSNSKLLKPKKELKGFKKVFLQPGETQTVIIDLDIDAYHYYNIHTKKYEIEGGEYIVYLGTSSTNIILETRVSKNSTTTPEIENFILVDYIKKDTNIVLGGYSLKDNYKKKVKGNSTKYILSILAFILIDVAFAVLCFSYMFKVIYFAAFLVVLILVNIFMIINVRRERKKYKEEILVKIKELEEELQEEVPYELLFLDSKKGNEIKNNKEKKEIEIKVDDINSTNELLKYYDDNYTIENVIDDLVIYMSDRGIDLSKEEARLIISSMASSKIIIVKEFDSTLHKKFIELLSEFFFEELPIINIDENVLENKFLFVKNELDNYSVSSLYNAINNGLSNPHAIHVIGCDNLTLKDLVNYFEPYVDFVENSLNDNIIKFTNKTTDAKNCELEVRNNIWYFMFLKEHEDIININEKIARNSIVININIKETNEKTIKRKVRNLNYYQFNKIINESKMDINLSENQFKKIDILEEYVSNKVKFEIGNKLNISIEKFLTLYLSLEGEELEGLDIVLGSKLIPLINKRLENVSLGDDENLLERLEKIFGEDNLNYTTRIIKVK